MSEQRLPSGQLIYDPRGKVTAVPHPLASRRGSLDGARIGVLDNSKWNASKLLRQVIAQLEAGVALGDVRFYKKAGFSRPAEAALLDQIAAEVDVVVTAIGD